MDYLKSHEELISYKKFLSWKRKNVTLRGMKDRYAEDNGGMAKYGQGLYTAFLGNMSMSKQYGQVYYLLGAIPKHPKVVNNTNDAEIFMWKIMDDYCKKNNTNYDKWDQTFFYKNTSISKEMQNLGYDGLVIKGREMVNYTPSDNIKYFENLRQLQKYYDDFIKGETLKEPKQVSDLYHFTNF